MKKSMLCAGLMSILGTAAYAEENVQPNMVQIAAATQQNPVTSTPPPVGTQTPVTGTQAPTTDTQAPAMNTPLPATNTQIPATGTPVPATGSPVPATNTPPANTQVPATDTTAPATGTQTPDASAPAATSTTDIAKPINCEYRIPAATTHLDQALVLKWAEKAAEQAFDLDYKTIDDKLVKLKTCFTDQGWQGFNDALQKSGNLNAIKNQNLTESSMISGESKITEIKENQWKVSIPMQVVYQNDKEKLTQPLTVDLVIGRKVSGDLGIMQMIAIPQSAGTSNNPVPATTPVQ